MEAISASKVEQMQLELAAEMEVEEELLLLQAVKSMQKAELMQLELAVEMEKEELIYGF